MFAKTWIILKNAWFLGEKALPCSISPPVCYLHLTFASLFEAMSQCFQSFILSSICCTTIMHNLPLFVFYYHQEETMILLFQIFVSRQLSSIRKVAWMFGQILKIWNNLHNFCIPVCPHWSTDWQTWILENSKAPQTGPSIIQLLISEKLDIIF